MYIVNTIPIHLVNIVSKDTIQGNKRNEKLSGFNLLISHTQLCVCVCCLDTCVFRLHGL